MSLRVLNKYLPTNSWTRTFLVTLLFLVLASALFWLDHFRAYETEVSVLFVTEEKHPAPVVADAMGAIMQTLTFALRAEEGLSQGLLLPVTDAKDEQKVFWNNHLTVKTNKESGILVFTQKADSESESREKADATLKTLMLATNIYYGEAHQVELRVIDKPLTRIAVSSWVSYGLAVLATALVFTSLFFGVLWVLSRKTVHTLPTIETHIGESVPWLDPQKFVAVKPETLTFQKTPEETVEETVQTVYPGKETIALKKPTKVAEKVAHAPSNLPVMSGALPQFGIEEVDIITEEPILDTIVSEEGLEKETLTFDATAEPTVEEYKRRLNELLKGQSI